LYQRIQEVLKGEEMSDAESQEPIGSVESNDLQGFISDDYSHILVYPKGSYTEGGVDLYTAPPKREWLGLTKECTGREELLGAIARGWCHEKNSHKIMDKDLALAIFNEIEQQIKSNFGLDK
jgi:hypothetical protein